MVSTGTVVVVGAVAGAAALGAYYYTTRIAFNVSVTPKTVPSTGSLTFTARNGTPNGNFTLSVYQGDALIALLPETGSNYTGDSAFTPTGEAIGTTGLAGASAAIPPGNYQFVVTDEASPLNSAGNHKTCSTGFTVS